jgi:hypothetical protein
MRRRLQLFWWWSSRAAAVAGVLLAFGLVALDVRSRAGTDRWLFHYMYPAPDDPPRWRWWNGAVQTGGGVIKLSLARLHHTPDSVGGGPIWPEPWLEGHHARLHPPIQSLSQTSQTSAVLGWLANRGLSGRLENRPWNGTASTRRLSATAPMWLLTMLSLLPMTILLLRAMRRRVGRGFAVEPVQPEPAGTVASET